MKWLIVDRSIEAILISLGNVWGQLLCLDLFIRTNTAWIVSKCGPEITLYLDTFSHGETTDFKRRAEKFKACLDPKSLTSWPWKWNYYSIIKKSLGLKVGIHIFLKGNFIRTQGPAFLKYIFCLLPFQLDLLNSFGKQFLLGKQFRRQKLD